MLEKHFIIRIRDTNDNPPNFDSEMVSFNVSEDFEVGQLIGTVKAEDLDIQDKIYYSIQKNEYLDVTPVSGEITVVKKIDYE